jgi:hypothetical protein
MLLLDDADPRRDHLREAFLALHSATITVPVATGGVEAATRACADINALAPDESLVVAALGSASLVLPAVSRSQRAQHRRIIEYLLLDPELPPVTDAWPDARVSVICDVGAEASLQARLRGWDLLRPEEIADWQPPD